MGAPVAFAARDYRAPVGALLFFVALGRAAADQVLLVEVVMLVTPVVLLLILMVNFDWGGVIIKAVGYSFFGAFVVAAAGSGTLAGKGGGAFSVDPSVLAFAAPLFLVMARSLAIVDDRPGLQDEATGAIEWAVLAVAGVSLWVSIGLLLLVDAIRGASGPAFDAPFLVIAGAAWVAAAGVLHVVYPRTR